MKGNIDGTYEFPEDEKHLYHVALTQRIPLGNMEFEDKTMVQKFQPRDFDRFEEYGSKPYRERRVMHNPMKVSIEEINKILYDNKSREEIIAILKENSITWRGNIGNDKLIQMYDEFKNQ